MISDKREINKYINNKFMQKIQPTTVNYEIEKPDIYSELKSNLNSTNEIINETDEPSGYKYIDDEPLHKIIETTPKTEFHYVLYNIVDDLENPFVKMLMCYEDNMMKFSNEMINNVDSDDIESDSSDDENIDEKIIPFVDESDEDTVDNTGNMIEINDETYLLEQCSQYLEKNFGITYENSEEFYKGYVQVGDRLYVFVNVSIIDIIIPEDSGYSWVIMDEIIHKKHHNNIPICSTIVEMFSTNPIIKYIYDEKDEMIELPSCVYVCKFENESYSNIVATTTDNISLISDKIQDKKFGNVSMFSNDLIINDENKYERYCLFTEDAIYVLHSDFTKEDIEMIEDKSCIRFPYQDKEFWAVKNNNLCTKI